MSANTRLLEKQTALQERGALDVKFCFALGLDSMAKTEVEDGVADFLGAYLDGRYTVKPNVGDAPTKSLKK